MEKTDTHLNLLDWLIKLRKGEINKDILLIRDTILDFKQLKSFEKFFFTKNCNYQVKDINDINNFSMLNENVNYVICGNKGLINKMIGANNKSILMECMRKIVDLNKEYETWQLTNKEDGLLEKFRDHLSKCTINKNYKFSFYLKQRNPIDIVFLLEKPIINEFIQNHINYFTDIFDTNYYFDNLRSREYLGYHLDILEKEAILTSWLAIIIYKLATFRIDDSDKKIGLFYKKELGIQSKPTSVKAYPRFIKKGMERIPLCKTVKAYNLKESPLFKKRNIKMPIPSAGYFV